VACRGGGEAGGGAGEAGGEAARTDGEGEWLSYKVQPYVDQSLMFDSVVEALHEGKAVGIFPEGGSHDRPTLLPFRAGASIMAFETLAKYPAIPIVIVPVGLNYFSGHRWYSGLDPATGRAAAGRELRLILLLGRRSHGLPHRC
jgi:glycerol-3-phosphate O-acyltransferase/dihydroxyacetone phosphate acyltransferase